MFAHIDFYWFFFIDLILIFSFIFKKAPRCHWRRKSCYRLGSTRRYTDIGDIDEIRGFTYTCDLPTRLLFIDWEYGYLKEVNDGGEFTRKINQKKKSDVSQACRCSLWFIWCRREYFFSNHMEFCESVR